MSARERLYMSFTVACGWLDSALTEMKPADLEMFSMLVEHEFKDRPRAIELMKAILRAESARRTQPPGGQHGKTAME